MSLFDHSKSASDGGVFVAVLPSTEVLELSMNVTL